LSYADWPGDLAWIISAPVGFRVGRPEGHRRPAYCGDRKCAQKSAQIKVVTRLAPASSSDTSRSYAAGIARGAAVIASLTILARIAGLARTLAFSQTVGATCLGTAFVTANQVPNLVYELVLGGALSSVMVPVLARSAARSASDPAEKAHVREIASALLTWTVIILVPITLAIVLAAGPIATALNPVNHSAACVHGQVVSMTADMLRVFAPQAILYGLSVVLFGLLQAFRRFAGYALAPLVASLVAIASYLVFVPLGKGVPLGKLSLSAQLVLSVGATLGISMLVLVALVPTWRLHLGLRPALRLPRGVARRAGGLAVVGLAEIVASEISTVVIIEFANGRGSTGALVIYNYAYQVFSTMNAVLALSVVLSAFPVLASREGQVFDRTSAGSTRAVLLVSCLGMAFTASVAVPAAHVLAQQPDQVPQLIQAFVLFAPALVGMGVIANLSRVMLALGRLTIAAVAVAGSWILAIVAQLILIEFVHARLVVGMLALGVSLGQIGAAIPLIVVTRRIRGKAAIEGSGWAMLAGFSAATAGGGVGVAISLLLPRTHKLLDAGDAVVAAVVAGLIFAVVAWLVDPSDMQALLVHARKALSSAGLPLRIPGGAAEPEEPSADVAAGVGAGRPTPDTSLNGHADLREPEATSPAAPTDSG
jgi:putative peptidoglycan lipid II flippase